MFAVISYKGKQHKVALGKKYKLSFTDGVEKDQKIVFSDILLVDDDSNVSVGAPKLEKAVVEAKVIENIQDKKVTGVKFKAKKRQKHAFGHRQDYTVAEITKIQL